MEAWRANGEGHVFPGPPAEWTADQRRLVSLTKEYGAAFTALSMRGHEPPKQEILEDYRRFREWWGAYSENPEIGENPYKKYSEGFSVKR